MNIQKGFPFKKDKSILREGKDRTSLTKTRTQLIVIKRLTIWFTFDTENGYCPITLHIECLRLLMIPKIGIPKWVLSSSIWASQFSCQNLLPRFAICHRRDNKKPKAGRIRSNQLCCSFSILSEDNMV